MLNPETNLLMGAMLATTFFIRSPLRIVERLGVVAEWVGRKLFLWRSRSGQSRAILC